MESNESIDIFTEIDEANGLNDRQKLFCAEYVKRKFNGKAAAIAAGYGAKSAQEAASRMLSKSKIQETIAEYKRNLSLRINIDADKIANEYAKIGFFDIGKLYDENGRLKSVKDLDKRTRAVISSIKVTELFERIGDDKIPTGITTEVKLWDKPATLDKLAKMIGVDGIAKSEILLTDKRIKVTYTDE